MCKDQRRFYEDQSLYIMLIDCIVKVLCEKSFRYKQYLRQKNVIFIHSIKIIFNEKLFYCCNL